MTPIDEEGSKSKSEFKQQMERWATGTPAGPKIKAEHTVIKGDTLSAIALKYYGSAAKDSWMRIYEANKDVIGDSPNLIRAGQVLKIPEI